jgi:hypothetical protein
MNTYGVEILNPKAKNMLQSMADLNFIFINTREVSKNDFINLLAKLRQKSNEAPSLEEIAQEVKKVRKK